MPPRTSSLPRGNTPPTIKQTPTRNKRDNNDNDGNKQKRNKTNKDDAKRKMGSTNTANNTDAASSDVTVPNAENNEETQAADPNSSKTMQEDILNSPLVQSTVSKKTTFSILETIAFTYDLIQLPLLYHHGKNNSNATNSTKTMQEENILETPLLESTVSKKNKIFHLGNYCLC